MDNEDFLLEVEKKFPLLTELRFFRADNPTPERLPPIVGLMSAMTDPSIKCDTCAVLPSRHRIATFTAVLSALSAAREGFPKLLSDYVENGFKQGERVSVLPTGHVFEFGGFFEEEYGQFFRLRLMGKGGGDVSFPISKAVLLEKTTRKSPKGTGKTRLGAPIKSPIDEILGIESGGNKALLSNEVMLVTTQREFIEFMETVYVCRADNPERPFLLKDVISWGVVNYEGEFEFRESAAASGAPLIAVSPRTEFIAEACRSHRSVSSRVIIDGAVRIKDMQSFDDIVDESKMLVIADHTRLDDFEILQERGCTIWKLPDRLDEFTGSEKGLLKEFNRAYKVASEFKLKIVKCESMLCDSITQKFRQAETLLRDTDADVDDLKLLSIAYSRLIDISAIVHIPDDEITENFRSSIEGARSSLVGRRLHMNVEANRLLQDSFEEMLAGLEPGNSAFREDKRNRLLELVTKLKAKGSRFVVLAPSIFSAESARVLLNEELNLEVSVLTIQTLSVQDPFDDIVLTGWPKSRHLKKLQDMYAAKTIHAFACAFEYRWFMQSYRKRVIQLNRWEGKNNLPEQLTGIARTLNFTLPEFPPEPPSDDYEIAGTESFLDGIRKGRPASDFDDHDAQEGRYVSFSGSAYGYMTKTHKIPRVTGLINGTIGVDERIPLATIDDMQAGDFVLFRAADDSQRDLIRQFAEDMVGVERYQKTRDLSEKWKLALRSLGDDEGSIFKALTNAGLARTPQAVHGCDLHPNG